MNSFLKDLQLGVRGLRHMPGSAVISVIVLGLGIGLCSFMFSVVYGVFFRGLDVPEPHRIFVLMQTRPEEDEDDIQPRLPDYVAFSERQTSFSGMFGVDGAQVMLSDGTAAWRLEGARVKGDMFSVLRVQPIRGRTFSRGEDTPGAPPNVVLGYSAWRDHFGLDESIIGRTMRVNGQPAQVIGVMPEGFGFPFNNDAWIADRADPLAGSREDAERLMVMGRLKDGVSRSEAAEEVRGIADQLARENADNRGMSARLETPERASTGGPLLIVFSSLMVAVLCVLLVACANVANLLLARASLRTRDAAVRAALGGSRMRVMTPLLAEALVLSAAGALLGILVANVAVNWFDGVTDPALTGRPTFIKFLIDWPILGFVGGLTVFTALFAGLMPALKVSRADVNAALKDQSRGSTGLQIGRLTKVLVTAEVALSVTLLIAAGLMTRSILALRNQDHPFDTAVFTARVDAPPRYEEAPLRTHLWEDVLAEARALPSVGNVALANRIPGFGSNAQSITVDGTVPEPGQTGPQATRTTVSTGYFGAFGVQIALGRDFNEQDVAGGDRVAIVNQSMVDRHFGGQNPIGRQFQEVRQAPPAGGGQGTPQASAPTLVAFTVVGVVEDLDEPPVGDEDFEPASYYVPLQQSGQSSLILIAQPRSGDPLGVTSDMRSALSRVDTDLTIYDVRTHAENLTRNTWFVQVFGTVFIVFGVAALFMASVGLYGVLSFSVSRRTQEMGIRMAMGATSGEVVQMIFRQGLSQLAVGLGVGLALAFGVTRLIGVLMFRVDPQDPVVFGAVLVTIVLVGMSASFFPARRATSVDPVEALRYD